MALKGGRKIVVRDREFRWKFSADRGKRQYGAPRRGHIVVQEVEDKPGTTLCVYVDSLRWVSDEHHDFDIGVKHEASVTPKDTRLIIETALDNGWDPTSRCVFSLCTKIVSLELADYRVLMLPSRG